MTSEDIIDKRVAAVGGMALPTGESAMTVKTLGRAIESEYDQITALACNPLRIILLSALPPRRKGFLFDSTPFVA